jgi:hypothetical protein
MSRRKYFFEMLYVLYLFVTYLRTLPLALLLGYVICGDVAVFVRSISLFEGWVLRISSVHLVLMASC